MNAPMLSMLGDAASEPYDWRRLFERLRGAYADSTLRNNAKDMRAFEAWCEAHGHAALPASPEQVAAFVADLMPRCAVRTVERRLYIIRRVHGWMRLPDPTADEGVRLAFRRGVRQGARRPKQAAGLSAELRDRLIAACPPTLLGLRDRALIAVGYDTLCRRSELVQLRIEDLRLNADGTARIRVRRSKTDQEGKGAYAYISAAGLRHLSAWLSISNLKDGPVFRPIFGRRVGRGAMHPRIVNRTLALAAELAGVDLGEVGLLSAHSLRVGPAQDLARAGRSTVEIMRAGRWRSVSGMIGYLREADLNVWANRTFIRSMGS